MKKTKFAALPMLLLAPLSLVGCSPANDDERAIRTESPVPAEDEHDHPHPEAGHHHAEGPHGGTLADWGGGAYHIEFTVDHDQQQAVVYILGEDAKTLAPVSVSGDTLLVSITEPAFQVELTADPDPSDPEGTASRFVGQHESLGKVQEFAGTISAEVDGTPYVGEFAEQPHVAH